MEIPKLDDFSKLNDVQAKLTDILPKLDGIPPKLDANMFESLPAFFQISLTHRQLRIQTSNHNAVNHNNQNQITWNVNHL